MGDSILNTAILIGFSFMLLAIILALYRLVKGPGMHDRIAAMDLMASITMGFILLYSLVIKKKLYIDIVIVLSLVSFISTVAISTYLKLKYSKP